MKREQKINIVILFALGGLIIGMLFQVIGETDKYISPNQKYKMALEIEALKTENQVLQERIMDYEKQITARVIALEDIRIDYESLLIDKLGEMKSLAGSTTLEGEGVVVFVSDGNRELQSNENPNNLVVHDIDIRGMLDELRFSGAEAISVNDQRVLLEYSSIKCVGPTIRINDRIFAAPYVIKAIGDRKLLEASINSPQSFTQVLRGWGLEIEVNTAVNVNIPAYEQSR